MGYAMFCSRKIMLVAQINDLQYRLTELTMRQQDLALKSSAYTAQAQQNGFNTTNMSDEQWTEYTNKLGSGSAFQDPNSTLAAISAAEKQIEMESKRLQTQLQAKQTELEAVEKGEEQGIKNATPKYA